MGKTARGRSGLAVTGVTAAAALLATVGVARAQGGGIYYIDSAQSISSLLDYGFVAVGENTTAPFTVTMTPTGGVTGVVHVHNQASFRMDGGRVGGDATLGVNASFVQNGGDIDGNIVAFENTSVNITGGTVGLNDAVDDLGFPLGYGVVLFGNSTGTISNVVTRNLQASDNSSCTVTGGSFSGFTLANDRATLSISNANVGWMVWADRGSTVNISGGRFGYGVDENGQPNGFGLYCTSDLSRPDLGAPTVSVTGGDFRFTQFSGATRATWTSGDAGQLLANDTAQLTVSGGGQSALLWVDHRAVINLRGSLTSRFVETRRLDDGRPWRVFQVSGTLADGTPWSNKEAWVWGDTARLTINGTGVVAAARLVVGNASGRADDFAQETTLFLDLQNQGGDTARNVRITSAALGVRGTPKDPAVLPYSVGDIPPGATRTVAFVFRGTINPENITEPSIMRVAGQSDNGSFSVSRRINISR